MQWRDRYGRWETPGAETEKGDFLILRNENSQMSEQLEGGAVGTYHPRHRGRRVVRVKVGGPPDGLLLDDLGALLGCSGGHHVVGGVWGVAPPAGSGRRVGGDFRGVERG